MSLPRRQRQHALHQVGGRNHGAPVRADGCTHRPVPLVEPPRAGLVEDVILFPAAAAAVALASAGPSRAATDCPRPVWRACGVPLAADPRRAAMRAAALGKIGGEVGGSTAASPRPTCMHVGVVVVVLMLLLVLMLLVVVLLMLLGLLVSWVVLVLVLVPRVLRHVAWQNGPPSLHRRRARHPHPRSSTSSNANASTCSCLCSCS